jgi:hypothetical protein
MADPRPTSGDGHDALTASSTESELLRSSQAFLADLEQLQQMELRKAAMDPEDPERPDIARRIEDLSSILLGRSAYQRRLADEGFRQADGHEGRHPSAVLSDWRDAEHRLMEGRSMVQRALEDAERYRTEYRTAFIAATDRERREDGG